MDIADPQHTGTGSREFNRNCTSLLSLEQLRNCIVLLEGEQVEDITGDKRGRRSAAAIRNAWAQPGDAAAQGEAAAAAHGLGHSPGSTELQIPRVPLPAGRSARREVDTSDEEDDASQELLAELQREDAMPVSAMRPISADAKAEIVAQENTLAIERVAKLGKRPRVGE